MKVAEMKIEPLLLPLQASWGNGTVRKRPLMLSARQTSHQDDHWCLYLYSFSWCSHPENHQVSVLFQSVGFYWSSAASWYLIRPTNQHQFIRERLTCHVTQHAPLCENVRSISRHFVSIFGARHFQENTRIQTVCTDIFSAFLLSYNPHLAC